MVLISEKTKRKYRKLFKRIWEKKMLYLFLLPAIIWYFIFCYIPIGGLILVLKDYSFAKGIWGSPFSEPIFKNFIMFFDNPLLGSMIKNTVVISVLRLTLFPLPIVLAIMLNEVKHPRYKKLVQTVTYFPFFISWAIITSMLEQLLTPYGQGGPLYGLLTMFDNSNTIKYFLVDANYFHPILLISGVWKTLGWNSIIYLAAITGINPELYEAAKIDGAGRFAQIRHVTLPGIRVTIGLLFILSLGSLVSTGFEQIYFLQTPANFKYSNVLDVFVVVHGIEKGKYALTTVAGLFQGIISLIIIVSANWILRRKAEISLW